MDMQYALDKDVLVEVSGLQEVIPDSDPKMAACKAPLVEDLGSAFLQILAAVLSSLDVKTVEELPKKMKAVMLGGTASLEGELWKCSV